MSTASDMVTAIDAAILAITTNKTESYEIEGVRYTALKITELRDLRKYYQNIASGETADTAGNPRFRINLLKSGDAK